MRANAPQLPGGGMGAAGIDWCISKAVRLRECPLAESCLYMALRTFLKDHLKTTQGCIEV